MTKTYLLVSFALLVAVLFAAMMFADGGSQLADVSWNSLPTLHWTAGSPTWN
ncbi:MAG: hypothetical protein KDE19_15620 [Caldilineaceae bacterium]|nr:hypothetical protein [Caldilineaceae bacterium]